MLTNADSDEVGTHVMAVPEVAGVRLLESVPTGKAGGPVVSVDAVRVIDGLPVQLILVTAEVDAGLRRRIRNECADLESVLARIDESVVAPFVDHGLDEQGRPYLLAARPGPSLNDLLTTEGPRPPEEVAATARAAAGGLAALAANGLVGPPPWVRRVRSDMVLGTPLPPSLTDLVATLGEGTGHEPPEVLGGGAWTASGQTYACASMLWTLLAGRPPYTGDDRQLARLMGAPPPSMSRDDVPGLLVGVLRSALASDPQIRPNDPGALAEALARVPAPAAAYPTMPPQEPEPASATPASAEARPLGSGYLLDSRIGRGATGHVWVGRRRSDGGRVAVKLLRSELADDPEVVTRFLRERTLLLRLRHPNLVRVHDLVAEGDVFGIVMDYVDGEDLRQVVARGRLAVPEAMTLLAQTASALAAVHAEGVVHRDVKPENILVTKQAGRHTALLSDFGIARAVEGSEHTKLIGTAAYLAPELVAGRAPGPAVDVYSLGITAYELFAGRPPFTAPTTEGVLRAHLEQQPVRPDGIRDDVWELIAACLAKDPATRPGAAEVTDRWQAPTPAGVKISQKIPAPVGTGGDRAVADAGTSGTMMSARPLAVRPPEDPKSRKRRFGRGQLIAVVAAVAILGAGFGAGTAMLQSRSSAAPSGSPAGKTASPTGLTPYRLPASVVVVDARSAKVSWSPQAESLAGFSGYIVNEVAEGRYVPRNHTVLPRGQTSFPVPLHAGRQTCFQVIALVSKAPPGPVVPPICVTSRSQ